MMKYPMAEIGNRLYDYYVVRYGSMLKNIRYVEYDVRLGIMFRLWRSGVFGIGLDPIISTFCRIIRSL